MSPQNQDLTQPKSFLEGVQNPSFEYKNSFYYYYFIIIIIVLYSQLYQNIITRCSLYKKLQWHDYYISSNRKKQKGFLCSQWNWNAFSKSNYKQKHAFSHIIQKAVENNLSEEKTETPNLWQMKLFTPHPTHPWLTPPLHDTPHPTPAWPTPPLLGGPFW